MLEPQDADQRTINEGDLEILPEAVSNIANLKMRSGREKSKTQKSSSF